MGDGVTGDNPRARHRNDALKAAEFFYDLARV